MQDPKNRKLVNKIDSLIQNSEKNRKKLQKDIDSAKNLAHQKMLVNENNISVLWEHELNTYKIMILVGESVDTLESNNKESISSILKILNVLGKDSEEVKSKIENLKKNTKKMKRIKLQLAENINLDFGVFKNMLGFGNDGA